MPAKIKPGQEFLGIGLIGPLREGSTGEFETAAGKELVASAIKAILSTPKRFQTQTVFKAPKRFMRDDFGSNLDAVRHESLDENTVNLMEALIVDAVEEWEPRVEIADVQSRLLHEQNEIQTHVEYKLKGTNETGNLTIIRNAQGKIVFKQLEAT